MINNEAGAYAVIAAWLHIRRMPRAGIMAAGHVGPQHAQHRSALLILDVVKEALDLRITACVCMAELYFAHRQSHTDAYWVHTGVYCHAGVTERQVAAL